MGGKPISSYIPPTKTVEQSFVDEISGFTMTTQVVSVKKIFKNPVLNFLSSVKLGAVLMTVLAVGSGVATFIESFYGGRDAAYELVYAAPWFEFTLALFVVSLILSFFKRMPYKPQQTGFALIHISMIIILISAGITRYFGYEGVMPIREGATVDYILSDKVHANVSTTKQEASFPVRLYKPGVVNIWKDVVLEGENYELGITEFWANYTEVYGEGPGGPAGVQYGASMDGEISTHVMTAGDRDKIGSVPARFLKSEFSGDMSISRYGDLRIHSGGESCTVAVTIPDGTVHSCGGFKFEITEFQSSYSMSGGSDPEGPLTNPMIRLAITDASGKKGERLLFALHPEFSMDHSGEEGTFADLDILYSVSSGIEMAHNSTDGLRARASFLISVLDMNSEEQTEIPAGEIFKVKEDFLYINDVQGFSFVPVKIMSSVVRKPATSENPNAPSAARLTLRDEQGNEASTICVKRDRPQTVKLGGKNLKLSFGPIKLPLSYSLTLDDFVLNTYPGSENPATFESWVLLNDASQGIVNQKVHIYMNHPLTHNAQSSPFEPLLP